MDYEAMLEAFYRQLDLTDSLIVDIGGHVGRHAFPLAEMAGEGGAVWAFEPLPEMRQRFVESMNANGVINVSLFPFALSSVNGAAEFCYIPNNPGESGLKERAVYNQSPSEIVRRKVCVRRLDDFVPRRQRVSFIKIDVEGAELYVLQGAQETIRDSRPIVAFECGSASYLGYHDTPELMYSLLDRQYYDIFSITGEKITEERMFARVSKEQNYWDYIALPRERSNLASLLGRGASAGAA